MKVIITMNSTSTKKMFTVLITLAMVFGVLSALPLATQSAYAASGTFTVNPTTYTAGTATGTSTVAFVSGGTFGSGSTVLFFLSTTTSSSGIVPNSGAPSNNAIGSVSLAAGTTSLSNVVTFTMFSGAAPGTYYILAEDVISGSPSGTYALGPQVTIVTPAPTVSIASSVTVGSSVKVSGSSFDAGASITLYLNYPGSSIVLGTTTTGASGSFSTHVTIPALAQGSYEVVAQETNTLSSTFPEGGITADKSTTVVPSISVSPMSTNGAVGSALTITGSGFGAGQTIAANSITIGGATTSHSSVTVSANGAFTVTVTLTSAISSSGPQTVTITTSGPAATYSFPNAVYKSVPTLSALGFSFKDVSSGSHTSGYPGDSVTAAIWNFPASTTVTITLGPYTIGTITTDSNGFGELPSTAVIPGMPYGSYIPTASVASQGVYAVTSSFYVNSEYFAMDPVGNVFGTTTTNYYSTEYIPYNAYVTVFAYGLNPLTSYVFTDSGSGGNVLALGLVVSISVGTPNAAGTAIYPAANGTIIFTYQPFFAGSYSGVATGTAETVTILGNSYFQGSITTSNTLATYFEIGAPSISSPSQGASLVPGTTGTVSLSNLVPFGATVYPTASDIYSLYLGTSLLTVTLSGTTGTTFEVAPSSPTTLSVSASGITFTVPSGINGLQSLAVVFAGAPASSALVSEYVVVTTPGSTSSAIGALYNSKTQTLYMWGYNFPSSLSSVTLDYMTYSLGVVSVTVTATSGGFFDTVPALHEPAGTYAVFLPSQTGVPSVTPATYTVSPRFVSLSGGYEPVGSPFTATAYGLQPNQNYLLYFGSVLLDEETTDSSGTFSYSETVPIVAAGTYSLTLAPASSPSTVVLSQPFVVVQNPAISLSTMSQYAFPGQLVQFSANVGSFSPSIPTGATVGYRAEISLDGTLLEDVPATYNNGVISGSFKMPNNLQGSYYEIGITGLASYTYTQTITTAESLPLTASAFTTTASTGAVTLTVTFTAPNYGALTTGPISAPGNYQLGSSPYYAVVTAFTAPSSTATGSITFSVATIGPLTTTFADTITSSPTTITVAAIPSSATTTSSPQTVSGTFVTYFTQAVQFSGVSSTPTVSDFFALAQGNGALLTGISSSQMAQIVANVSNAITTSMQVPLSELNASVAAINGAVATIKTAFGNMTATLSSINATVSGIQGDVVTLQTSLGNVQTSLNSINATLVSVNGGVATISTSLGNVQTSLNSIGATVNSTASSVSGLVGSAATIQTSLGTISGKITSVSNGVATVQTSLGTLQTDVSAIKLNTSNISSLTTGVANVLTYLYVAIAVAAIVLILEIVILVRKR